MDAPHQRQKMIEYMRNDSKPKRVDAVSDTLIYIGYSEAGMDESAPHWRIEQIDTTGNITSITNPGGDNSYVYIWDDRATYSYL